MFSNGRSKDECCVYTRPYLEMLKCSSVGRCSTVTLEQRSTYQARSLLWANVILAVAGRLLLCLEVLGKLHPSPQAMLALPQRDPHRSLRASEPPQDRKA
mmetsp:Transcript_56178/g.149965  ORF Transcript_56178/g.149965 Transcript_56178/m.149965 type:complete len:100 (+) Transcript_56178:125-424(+)